jgi:hypothetical protein
VTFGKTDKGIQEQPHKVLTTPVVVQGNTLSFEPKLDDLPRIASYVWEFGADSGAPSQDGSSTILFDSCDQTDHGGGTSLPAGSTIPTTAAPTTTSPPVSPLGSSLTYKTGSVGTVYAVQQPPAKPAADATPPDDGFTLVAVDAQVCAAPAPPATTEIEEKSFQVKTDDNRAYPTRAALDPTVKPALVPAFPARQDIPAGQCTRGWITFQVPTGHKVDEIIYSPDSTGQGALIWKVA